MTPFFADGGNGGNGNAGNTGGNGGTKSSLDSGGSFLYYYHPDHLGSTAYVTDKDGEVYEHLQYFPFGETWVQESANTIQRVPYRYTSKELDEETGLYYYGARYYDPRTSVWVSADPILGDCLDGRPNDGVYRSVNLGLFTYGANNPLIFIDPTGLANVLVVTGEPGGAGGNFETAAATWVTENTGSDDTVITINAAGYGSVDDLIRDMGEAFGDDGIDQMSYFGHSYSGGLSVFYGNESIDNRWIDSSTDLSSLTFNPNSSIYLFGCNGGTGGDGSIAQIFANRTGANAYGYTSYTFFSEDRALANFERKPTNADVNRIVPQAEQLWLVPNNGRPMTEFTPRMSPGLTIRGAP